METVNLSYWWYRTLSASTTTALPCCPAVMTAQYVDLGTFFLRALPTAPSFADCRLALPYLRKAAPVSLRPRGQRVPGQIHACMQRYHRGDDSSGWPGPRDLPVVGWARVSQHQAAGRAQRESTQGRWACDGGHAMVGMRWWARDGGHAMVVMRWWACDGGHAMVGMRWCGCLLSNLTAPCHLRRQRLLLCVDVVLPCLQLSIEPGSPHCFLTSGEDGRIRSIDLRSNSA